MSSDMLPGYWAVSAQLDDARRKLDACAPYLKDGETPAERIQREIDDNVVVLVLLEKERKENAALREASKAFSDYVRDEQMSTDGPVRYSSAIIERLVQLARAALQGAKDD